MSTVMNRQPVACFAPPLTDEKLAEYEALIAEQPQGEVKDEMDKLLSCIKVWWELPESKKTPKQWEIVHGGKKGTFPVTALEDEHVQAMWDTTPWMRELNTLSTVKSDGLFDSLQGDLRNAAFHLLWYAKELTLDREPLSQDKLPV